MNIDIWLGKVQPSIAGHGRVHIDGRQVVEPIKPPRLNEYGDGVRERIVGFITGRGEANITEIAAHMNLSKQSLRIHLSRLVRDERLDRIEPARRGSGQFVAWRPCKCQ